MGGFSGEHGRPGGVRGDDHEDAAAVPDRPGGGGCGSGDDGEKEAEIGRAHV